MDALPEQQRTFRCALCSFSAPYEVKGRKLPSSAPDAPPEAGWREQQQRHPHSRAPPAPPSQLV